MSGKRSFLQCLFRILLKIFLVSVVLYCCVIGYLCIRERSVLTTVPQDNQFNAIIVLGAQVKADGSLSVQLEWRLDAAYEAYQQKAVPVVVCGAKGKDEPLPEAVAMKNYLIAKGIPENSIFQDPDSFNTKQNLMNAAKLLGQDHRKKKVLIVTSDYHVPRALALAKDIGFEACGLGSPCKPEYWLKNHTREALAWCKYWGVKYLHLPLE